MTAVEVLTFTVNALFVLASLAALRLWLRHRSTATLWLLATFVAFDVAILSGLLPQGVDENVVVMRLTAAMLLLSPWLLFRFAEAVVAAPAWMRRAADVLTGAVVVATLALPDFPSEGTEPTGVVVAWLVFVVLVWGLLDVVAGGLLVRASIGEPGVVRSRLRVLAAAAIGLGLYIPLTVALGGGAGGEASDTTQLVTQLIAAVLGGLFLLGFAPPPLLRAAWRSQDERRLYEAALGLMTVHDPGEVAAVVVPGVRQVMGAPSVRMWAPDGRIMAQSGPDPSQLMMVREVQTRDLADHTLEVVVAPTMPIFGSEELQQLDRLELLAELALDRVRLLAAERKARDDVERLNDELESFVYTTSHDLKNPVIALIGYLDVLAEDHAADLDGEVAHILQRMQVNARHMDSLIRDLLELSRVGRVDVSPDRVDLALLVDDVTRDVQSSHPGLRVERGALPDVWMNATRARQLFTNLIDNAAAYGGRDDITVTVLAEEVEGGVRLVVRDDGRGIPEEHLERVFGVFERLDPDHPGGTGMGLAICRRVVESVGGKMTALPSDGGAAFQIDLPQTAVSVGRRPLTTLGGTPT